MVDTSFFYFILFYFEQADTFNFNWFLPRMMLNCVHTHTHTPSITFHNMHGKKYELHVHNTKITKATLSLLLLLKRYRRLDKERQ